MDNYLLVLYVLNPFHCIGLNEATVKKYIAEQEIHGKMSDKISIKEYEDPFKGGK